MVHDSEDTEFGPPERPELWDDDVTESGPPRAAGTRNASEVRTALAVGVAALLVVVAVLGGGLAWAFWSFSHGTSVAGTEVLPEPSSPAGVISPPATSTVSIGVPDVVSLSLAAATKLLSDAGLARGPVTSVRAEGFSAGTVVTQTPAPRALIARGSSVALSVSEGSPAVGSLPSVVGLTVARARRVLASAGVSVGTVSLVFSERAKEGIVISTSADGARPPKRGDSVNLTVSKGRPPLPMPDIQGMTPDRATAICSGAGITLVFQPAGSSRGIVYRQSPAAGASVAPGASATAWVDTAPVVAISAKVTRVDDTWEKYNKQLGAHITCTSAVTEDRSIVSYAWQVDGADVDMSGTGTSISFILPGYRRYGSTRVRLTVVDSAGQSSSMQRFIEMNWDTGTLK